MIVLNKCIVLLITAALLAGSVLPAAAAGVMEKAFTLAGPDISALFYGNVPFFFNDDLFNAGGIFSQVVDENYDRFSERVGFHPRKNVAGGVIIFREKGTAAVLLEVDFDYETMVARLDEDLETRQSIKGKTMFGDKAVYQLNAVRGNRKMSLCPLPDGFLFFTAPEQMESYLEHNAGPVIEVPWAFKNVDLATTPLCGFMSFKKGLPPFIKNVPPMAMHMLSGLNRLFLMFSTTELSIQLETADLPQAQALSGMLNQMKSGLSMQVGTSLSQLEQELSTMSPFKLIAATTTTKVAGLKLAAMAFENLTIEAHPSKPLLLMKLAYEGLDQALPSFMRSPSMLVTTGAFIAVALPNFTRAQMTARVKACTANLRVLEGALEMYDLDRTESTPITRGEIGLASPLGRRLLKEGYLKEMPACPGGGAYMHVGDCRVTCTVHGTVKGPGR